MVGDRRDFIFPLSVFGWEEGNMKGYKINFFGWEEKRDNKKINLYKFTLIPLLYITRIFFFGG